MLNLYPKNSNRCDTEVDCADKSDELGCAYMTLGPDYAKELVEILN